MVTSGMVKTTVYLDEEVARAFHRLAKTRGRSQAELIREATAAFVREAGRPRPRHWGKFRSGRKDVSARVDEILNAAGERRQWP